MKNILFVAGATCAALLVSCTGDPTRGGIFWSPSKAQERRQQLVMLQDARAEEAADLDRTIRSKQSRLRALMAKINRAKSASASADSDAETAQLQAEAARLQQEINMLSSGI